MASHGKHGESEEEREEGSKEEEKEKEEEKQDLGEKRSGSVAVNEEEKEKRFGDKSRFLPEVIDPNRVTIV